jgi:hypothetical protein
MQIHVVSLEKARVGALVTGETLAKTPAVDRGTLENRGGFSIIILSQTATKYSIYDQN